MVKIIGISSSKGGVGKTATVANLGVALAQMGKRVVVIDCNITNPHLGLQLGTSSLWPVTLNDVLRGYGGLEKCMYTHASGLKIVPASFDYYKMKSVNMRRLRSRIKSLFNDDIADYVILDSSPGLANEAMLTLKCSDEVYFVATPHLPSVIDITKCCHEMKSTDAKPMGVILNRVRGKKYEIESKEISSFTNLPIVGQIPEDEGMLESTNFKMPLVLMKPKAKASKAYFRLAARIAGESEVPNTQEPEQSILKRILSKLSISRRRARGQDGAGAPYADLERMNARVKSRR